MTRTLKEIQADPLTISVNVLNGGNLIEVKINNGLGSKDYWRAVDPNCTVYQWLYRN